ncbi:MAG: FtsX-like permease family protein [Mangrovibacterium sp.]
MNLNQNFQISFRHLKADKANTLINFTGLVIGLSIVTVILVFVLNELGYNHSFVHRDRIYRIINYSENYNIHWANTPFVTGVAAKDQLAEVEAVVHQFNISDLEVKKGEEFMTDQNMLCTEGSFFDVFGMKLLWGSLSGFDESKNKVLLSRSAAATYFGTENPVGKILAVRQKGVEQNLEVAGVFQDFPQNSTIKATLIGNTDFGLEVLSRTVISTGEAPSIQEMKESWSEGAFFTNYLLLKKGASAAQVESKLRQLGREHSEEDNKLDFSLQPLNDIYFGSNKLSDNNSGDKGNRSMLFILASIGLLILLVACINYLNLSSAQALTQTKSLAVRRVCGAPRQTLIAQMVQESMLISLLALPFALLIGYFALPYLSQLLGKTYTIEITDRFLVSFSILILIAAGTGALSGLLVALKINSFRLVETLKGKYSEAGNRHVLRKAMVVFQISVFIVLIAVMIFVQKQVHYAFSKDLGIEKEGLLRIPLGDHNYELFKQEISKNSNILHVSGALWIPPHKGKMYLSIPRADDKTGMAKVNGLFVDYDFARTMGMQIVMGSDFDREKNNSGVLVNESAIKALGLKEVIGEQTAFGPVIGVVKDFNMYSIHEAIVPMLIGLNPQMCREVAVKINTRNAKTTIDFLQKTWKSTGGTTAFDFDFTNDMLEQIYQSDIRFSRIIGLLAGIAILIASLGLFGLSLLMSRQKTKEIGIRKVSGARVSEVVVFLNRDFVIWVALAFVLSTPVAYFAIQKWLENFAYKTNLSWWIFALAGLLALGIALLTVSWQSWKAATRNPVEALRYE